MAVRRLAPQDIQPSAFAFNAENAKWVEGQIAKFPEGRQASAVIPLLWRAQEQHDGWLPEAAIRVVAETLDMPYIRVLEVATFYTMFNLSPVGKFFVQLCGTTPCMLRGAEDLKDVCREVIGEQNSVTSDGMLSWLEVECLGACVNAPMVQINKDYYEDLTAERFKEILADLRSGKDVAPGPQIDRHLSAPLGGPTTLIDFATADIKQVEVKEKVSVAPSAEVKPVAKPKAKVAETLSLDDADRPEGLEKARDGEADNLQLISGIGPKIEGILHSLGIFHFDQIAKWSEKEVDWVDGYLRFKGRIGRDNWIEQSKILSEGGETEFSARKTKKK